MSERFAAVLESIKDLSKDQVDGILSLAKKLKDKGQIQSVTPSFGFKTPIVATCFLEHSTRTKNSFAIAAQRMGALYLDFNAQMSSLSKGEQLYETLLTLHHQGVDLCIIRTPVAHELAPLKSSPPIRIINGGDGTNQHPTQALLDLFTLQEVIGDSSEPLESLRGKSLAIIGDIYHSRVAHSLIDLLPMYGIKIILCGPDHFQLDGVQSDSKNISTTTSLDKAIDAADALYLLRIQKERHKNPTTNQSLENYHTDYGVTLKKLTDKKRMIPVLHPGPANIGVEIAGDLVRSPLYKAYLQVENSIYIRQAIIKTSLEKAVLNTISSNQQDSIGSKFSS